MLKFLDRFSELLTVDSNMRIGIIQMRLTSEINKNVLKILSHIRDAHKSKLDLLCFPECALSGYIVDHHKMKWEQIRNGIEKFSKHQIHTAFLSWLVNHGIRIVESIIVL